MTSSLTLILFDVLIRFRDRHTAFAPMTKISFCTMYTLKTPLFKEKIVPVIRLPLILEEQHNVLEKKKTFLQ